MGKQKTSDTSYSNAGDDFHILWTIRKSLELLNSRKEGLKLVALEGLVNKENAVIDPDGDICLGVDLSEYYGGESFPTASQVIISQLKYSTVHPNLAWTASKICSGKGGNTHGSIIDRPSGTNKLFGIYFPARLGLQSSQHFIERSCMARKQNLLTLGTVAYAASRTS